MLTNINKYPFFDLSEVIIERDLSYKAYKALKPVKTGNYVPDIKLDANYSDWQTFYNGAPTHGQVVTRQLFSKPLVISFYSNHWNERGIEQLKQLNALQYEIKANGGNLVIINADGVNEELAKIAWEHNLSLNFYSDNNNVIAEKFRVYSEEDPTWGRFAGIDVNVPLLATYVVDTAKHIVFDYVDRNLTNSFVADEILTAVYSSALNTIRKSA